MVELEVEGAQVQAKPRRRGSDARVDHQPGLVLHATPWRETSLIVECFTRDYGRVALVARGAKRPTSQFRGLLAPFAPLSFSWSGRNEIKNLMRVEWVGGLVPLRGNALLAAFYANELIVRLLARADPHEGLFESYLQLLRGLVEARRILSGVRGIAFTDFTAADVVRHPLVARIIDAYEKDAEEIPPGK